MMQQVMSNPEMMQRMMPAAMQMMQGQAPGAPASGNPMAAMMAPRAAPASGAPAPVTPVEPLPAAASGNPMAAMMQQMMSNPEMAQGPQASGAAAWGNPMAAMTQQVMSNPEMMQRMMPA